MSSTEGTPRAMSSAEEDVIVGAEKEAVAMPERRFVYTKQELLAFRNCEFAKKAPRFPNRFTKMMRNMLSTSERSDNRSDRQTDRHSERHRRRDGNSWREAGRRNQPSRFKERFQLSERGKARSSWKDTKDYQDEEEIPEWYTEGTDEVFHLGEAVLQRDKPKKKKNSEKAEEEKPAKAEEDKQKAKPESQAKRAIVSTSVNVDSLFTEATKVPPPFAHLDRFLKDTLHIDSPDAPSAHATHATPPNFEHARHRGWGFKLEDEQRARDVPPPTRIPPGFGNVRAAPGLPPQPQRGVPAYPPQRGPPPPGWKGPASAEAAQQWFLHEFQRANRPAPAPVPAVAPHPQQGWGPPPPQGMQPPHQPDLRAAVLRTKQHVQAANRQSFPHSHAHHPQYTMARQMPRPMQQPQQPMRTGYYHPPAAQPQPAPPGLGALSKWFGQVGTHGLQNLPPVPQAAVNEQHLTRQFAE